MPKHPPAASTLRRHELADFIDLFGEIIVKKYSTCVKANQIYQVHVRSGKCRACNKLSQRYDIKVTQSEFQRLTTEKIRLKKEIQKSQDL
jgi:predicted metal-binding protein